MVGSTILPVRSNVCAPWAAFLSLITLAAGISTWSLAANKMIYGETGRLDRFDPYTIHEASGHRLADLIFDGLVEIGPGYEYISSLATRWKISPNRTVVKFYLRDDVTWHDHSGATPRKFTATDVVKTIDIVIDGGSEIPNKSRFDAISHARAISDYEVDVYLNYAVHDPLRLMMFKILPSHQFAGMSAMKRSLKFSTSPVGTGPYKFVAANSQGEIMLSANASYFKGAPRIKTVLMRSFTDQSVLSKSLMYASLDLATYISPRDLSEVMGDKRVGVVSYDALSYSFIGINTARPYLSDKRLRQALTHAINREEMLEAFFEGKGDIISGPFPPSSWAYNLDIKPRKYNIERAKKLIELSGFRNASQPLHFAVPLSGNGEMIKRIVLAYQNYLAQVGIKVDLQFMDWLVWKEKVLRDRDYDLTIASWSFDDASNIASLFHSSQSVAWGHNLVQFKNPQVDALLNEAAATNDPQKRKAIYHKLHAILSDEAPYTYLWTLKHHAAYQKRLQRVRVEPYAFFKHIVSWYATDGENLQ